MLTGLLIFLMLSTLSFGAPLSLLRDGGSDGFSDFNPDRFPSAHEGSGFLDGLGEVLSSTLFDGISGNIVGIGRTNDLDTHLNAPKLPPTRVSINFGVSVDVGELPPGSDGSASQKLKGRPATSQAASVSLLGTSPGPADEDMTAELGLAPFDVSSNMSDL
ncbi:hypothetical protein JCM10908_003014 [Rhodotorula pacifica]|uniref:uncharacterized protein n=1 Tax=Rhodotorula pacifica TaxID=1495444 RepID=UPI003172864E